MTVGELLRDACEIVKDCITETERNGDNATALNLMRAYSGIRKAQGLLGHPYTEQQLRHVQPALIAALEERRRIEPVGSPFVPPADCLRQVHARERAGRRN